MPDTAQLPEISETTDADTQARATRYHHVELQVVDSEDKPVPSPQVGTMGASIEETSPETSTGKVLIKFNKPKLLRHTLVYATTATHIGFKLIPLAREQAYTDAGKLTILPVKKDVWLTYAFIQLLRGAHYSGSHIRVIAPLLLIIVWLWAEFAVLTPKWVDSAMKTNSLHLIKTNLNAEYSTTAAPLFILPDQTVHLHGDGTPVEVTSSISIPASSKLVISPGTELAFASGAGIECHGSIEAKGTEVSPILFTSLDENEGWQHVAIVRAKQQSSIFDYCTFQNGRGRKYYTPVVTDARTEEKLQALESSFRPDPKQYTIGGAMLVYESDSVVLENCTFRNNCATAGGAMYIRKDSIVRLKKCAFTDNCTENEEKNDAPGGAIYLQSSRLYVLSDSRFIDNCAKEKFSCGGAIYVGYLSSATVEAARFERNAASHAGGAIYCLNLQPDLPRAVKKNVGIESSVFISNSAGSASAIYIDQGIAAQVVDCKFVGNEAGVHQGPKEATEEPTVWAGGTVVVSSTNPDNSSLLSIDALSYRQQANAMVYDKQSFHDTRFFLDVQERGHVSANLDDHANISIKSPARILDAPIHKRQPLPENPCFKLHDSARDVDTIVIHHVSAINWFDSGFQREYGAHDAVADAGEGVTPDNLEDHKYSAKLCQAIFRVYGVASHYMVGRDGTIHRLVDDDDIAYHAGVSKMPVDERSNVNDFSIGIELISSHPDDDPAIRDDPTLAYLPEQYQSLKSLVRYLCGKYPIRYVVGHDEISPDRKKDPGPLFDWSQIRNEDAKLPHFSLMLR